MGCFVFNKAQGMSCGQGLVRVSVSSADEVCVDSLSTTSSESSFVRTSPPPTPTVCHHRAVPSTCWLNFNHAPHPPTHRPPDHLAAVNPFGRSALARMPPLPSLLFDSHYNEQMVWLFQSINCCVFLFI